MGLQTARRERGLTREVKGWKTREAERLRGVDEALKTVKMEDREEGPEGGCNLAGGSRITPQRCHRHKHTKQNPWMAVVLRDGQSGENRLQPQAQTQIALGRSLITL